MKELVELFLAEKNQTAQRHSEAMLQRDINYKRLWYWQQETKHAACAHRHACMKLSTAIAQQERFADSPDPEQMRMVIEMLQTSVVDAEVVA